MVKNKKLQRLIILAIICLFFVPTNYSKPSYANDWSYGSMAVMCDDVLVYNKEENKKLPMASTTKIFTALTVIENCKNLADQVVVPKEAVVVEGTSIYLKQNERLTVEELLYGLMLRSGNDAAVALAVHTAGTCDEFAKLMNATATKYGLKNTSLKNPHGLDQKDHYTTAKDLATFTMHSLKNPIFRKIVSSKSYEIAERENCPYRYFVNKNRLLNSLDGCIGVKTGYTSKAGRCLVSAINDGEKDIVCVVLNCKPMFEESMKLLTKAKDEYAKQVVLKDYAIVGEVSVQDGEKTSCKVYHKKGFARIVKKCDLNDISITYDYPKTIKAPIKKDEKIGVVKVFAKNDLIFEDNLYIIEEVKSKSIIDKLKNILKKW